MVLLDTNILVHAADVDSSLFSKAREIRDKAAKGELNACISLQNLSEFYSVITNSKQVEKPLTSKEAKEEVEKYLACSNIKKIEIKESTIRVTMKLAERYCIIKQSVYDTQIVATMLENDITKIFTRNIGDFSVFKEIEKEDPFENSCRLL